MEPRGPEELPGPWREVRRRHPDADLVLVGEHPPVEPGADAGRAAADRLPADLALVAAVLAEAWEALGTARPEVGARVRFGSREDTVAATARHRGRLATAPAEALWAHLVEWDRTAPRAGHDLLVARRDGLELVASHSGCSGLLTLTVTAPPRHVGRVAARELAGR